jgi:hypothetical protein
MEVLKVKIDFEKPGSGSRHESPIISKRVFKPKTVKAKVHIFKNKRINCRFLKIIHCSNNSVMSEKCIT